MAFFSTDGPPTRMKKLMFWYRSHFTHSPARDGIFYGLLLLVLVAYGIIAVASPLLMPVCEKESPDLPFRNPDFNPDPCLTTRFLALGGLTIRECEFVKNTLMAVFLGSVIGYERRGPDRAAGIRSMSLTALGACCFTIGGNFACQTGPMSWDSSRISASIPSGVGFLGAGIIWKGFVKSDDGGPDVHQVHGLTTAASVWLSAAIGTACGGGLFPHACFTVAGIVLMLRFGPRNSELVAEPDDSAEDEHPAFAESASEPLLFQGAGPSTLSLSDVLQPLRPEGPFNPPFQDTMRMKKSLSINRRPTLTVHT